MLAPLPERIIERLARSLVTVELKAGEIAVREGDEGDRFYIVESGTLEVSRDGAHIAEIGPATASARSRSSATSPDGDT